MLQKGDLGKFIRSARESKKMSQEQVANQLGEKRSSYAEWEGNTEPKVSTFIRLAEILEFDPLEIFKEYKLSINKAGIVTSKIESIQASLDELKKMFNSDDLQRKSSSTPPNRDASKRLPGDQPRKSDGKSKAPNHRGGQGSTG